MFMDIACAVCCFVPEGQQDNTGVRVLNSDLALSSTRKDSEWRDQKRIGERRWREGLILESDMRRRRLCKSSSPIS